MENESHDEPPRDRTLALGDDRRLPTPGTFKYICADHPWAIAQLIVEP
jgi:hypothetical protein